MSIWATCNGNQQVRSLSLEPWRVVEDQFTLSSRDLVDSHEEHDVLESLIESSKPRVSTDTHYLIFTPFRYPPLKYGSRFGGVFEPSLWYGSLKLRTALAEVAYYRFKFFQDTTADLGYVQMNMTAFTVALESQKGIDLTEPPFDQYQSKISNKTDYQDSQSLGSAMREEEIEAFLYYSARTDALEKNVAAFTPSVFHADILHQQNWLCLSHQHTIEFTRRELMSQEQVCFTSDVLS
jgi:RES domain